MMKKILTLVLIAVITLVSCGKDDNPQNQDEQIDIKQLIGKLRLQSVTENGRNLLNDCNKQDTYVFKSDNTYTKVHYAVDGVNCK